MIITKTVFQKIVVEYLWHRTDCAIGESYPKLWTVLYYVSLFIL